MPRIITPLTDAQCRKAVYSPKGRNRLYDGGGLYLEMAKSGAKHWRMKYRRPGTGRENVLSFGAYPDVLLPAARRARAAAQECLDRGVDPAVQREIDRVAAQTAAANSFEALADEWLALQRPKWSAGYYERMHNALKANAYPRIGPLPIDSIPGKIVLDAVVAVQARGALEMARRVLSAIGMVFRYASATGRARADVTQGLEQFLQERPPVQHHPHVDVGGIPELLRRIEVYHGRPETAFALRLMMRTFPRTQELRWAEWPEFDLDGAMWAVPGTRMKGTIAQKSMDIAHLIPLSRQAVDILRNLRNVTGRYRYLFPGMRRPATTPISGETMNKALKIMGFEGQQTGHGFRGLASTILNESKLFHPDAIERQLAHRDRNKVRRAYDHSLHLDERRRLLQWWSDYLDDRAAEAKTRDNPIPQSD